MASNLLFRLQNFLAGDFKSLLDDWYGFHLASISTPKTFKTPAEEGTMTTALELIHLFLFHLKRGIGLIEGH
jgi:hypothetical protein